MSPLLLPQPSSSYQRPEDAELCFLLLRCRRPETLPGPRSRKAEDEKPALGNGSRDQVWDISPGQASPMPMI
eukprot:5415616-Pyramimonas_sp.AAC.1